MPNAKKPRAASCKAKALPKCPVCQRAPEVIECGNGDSWSIACDNSTGRDGYYHHVGFYAATQAKAEALWRKLASARPKP